MQVYCSKKHANHGSNRFCIQCGEPLPLRSGQVIDNRYRIVNQLGQGGFGRTYLAQDIQQSVQCVLKEFAPQVEKTELKKAKELFEREANVLKKLQHPQIPRFHSSLQVKMGNKDFFFLVQDYVEGKNYLDLLAERIDQGRCFNESEILTLLRQMLPVLSYIHSQDVVHRDISPDNFICRHTDKLPVLIDFGGVKQVPASQGFWFTQLPANRTLLGKKGYAPEEQLRQGKAFASSDLYSLAVSALVLLTGKEPQKLYDSFQGKWLWEEITLSQNLEAILKKMLAHKPSDRYQKASEVLQDLQSTTPAAVNINPQISKIQTQVAAPGRKRVGAIATGFHNRTQAISRSLPLPVWLRPFAMSLLGTTVVVLIFAGTWAAVTAVIRGVSSISIPTVSLPKIPQLPKLPGGQSNAGESRRINKIFNRRQQLEISEGFLNQTVNEIFYTKKPELNRRPLTGDSQDKALREEWYSIAENLLDKLEQASLSTSVRRKLGSYSQSDYEKWEQRIQAGQLGNYTVKQLNIDTNQKFDKLFPGVRQGNLNQTTFGQIWYALAAEQLNDNG